MKTKFEQFIIIIFLLSIPFIIYFLTQTKSIHNIKGTVIDFGATVNDTGIHSFLIVNLEDNRTVIIKYQLASKLNIGKKILIHEKTTKLFDIKTYKIMKWY